MEETMQKVLSTLFGDSYNEITANQLELQYKADPKKFNQLYLQRQQELNVQKLQEDSQNAIDRIQSMVDVHLNNPIPTVNELKEERYQKILTDPAGYAYQSMLEHSDSDLSEEYKSYLKKWAYNRKYTEEELRDIADNKFGQKYNFNRMKINSDLVRNVNVGTGFYSWLSNYKYSEKELFKILEGTYKPEDYGKEYILSLYNSKNPNAPKHIQKYAKTIISKLTKDDYSNLLNGTSDFNLNIPKEYWSDYGKVLLDNKFDPKVGQKLINHYKHKYGKRASVKGFENYLKNLLNGKSELEDPKVRSILGLPKLQKSKVKQISSGQNTNTTNTNNYPTLRKIIQNGGQNTPTYDVAEYNRQRAGATDIIQVPLHIQQKGRVLTENQKYKQEQQKQKDYKKQLSEEGKKIRKQYGYSESVWEIKPISETFEDVTKQHLKDIKENEYNKALSVLGLDPNFEENNGNSDITARNNIRSNIRILINQGYKVIQDGANNQMISTGGGGLTYVYPTVLVSPDGSEKIPLRSIDDASKLIKKNTSDASENFLNDLLFIALSGGAYASKYSGEKIGLSVMDKAMLTFADKYPMAFQFLKGIAGSTLINQTYNQISDALNWHGTSRDYVDGLVSAGSNLAFGFHPSNLTYTGILSALNLYDVRDRETGGSGLSDEFKYGLAAGMSATRMNPQWLTTRFKYGQYLQPLLTGGTAAATTAGTIYFLENDLNLPYEEYWKPAVGQFFNMYANPKIINWVDNGSANLTYAFNFLTQGDAANWFNEGVYRIHLPRAWSGKGLPARNKFIQSLEDGTPYISGYAGPFAANRTGLNGYKHTPTPIGKKQIKYSWGNGEKFQLYDASTWLPRWRWHRPEDFGGGYSFNVTPQQYELNLNNSKNGLGTRYSYGFFKVGDDVVQFNPEQHMLLEQLISSENNVKQMVVDVVNASKRFVPGEKINLETMKNGYEHIINEINENWKVLNLNNLEILPATSENLQKSLMSDRRDQAGQHLVSSQAEKKISDKQKTWEKRLTEGHKLPEYEMEDFYSHTQAYINTNGEQVVLLLSPKNEIYTLFVDVNGSGTVNGNNFLKALPKALGDSGMAPEATITIKPFDSNSDLRPRRRNHGDQSDTDKMKNLWKYRMLRLKTLNDYYNLNLNIKYPNY